jgi:hypothetical protein
MEKWFAALIRISAGSMFDMPKTRTAQITAITLG